MLRQQLADLVLVYLRHLAACQGSGVHNLVDRDGRLSVG